MKKIIPVLFSALFFFYGSSQVKEYQCYPGNWWTGMKNPKLQLMIHGEGIGNAKGLHDKLSRHKN